MQSDRKKKTNRLKMLVFYYWPGKTKKKNKNKNKNIEHLLLLLCIHIMCCVYLHTVIGRCAAIAIQCIKLGFYRQIAHILMFTKKTKRKKKKILCKTRWDAKETKNKLFMFEKSCGDSRCMSIYLNCPKLF